MTHLLKTPIGRLRLLGFLEGCSLLVLLFIAMPVKYGLGDPSLVKSVGLVHGILFVLFVIYTLTTATEFRWRFGKITWKLLLASVIPFGNFYVDRKILSNL